MKLPAIRSDIEVQEFYESSLKFAALSDKLGIALQPIALPFNIYNFLKNYCGRIELSEAENLFSYEIGNNYPQGFLSNLVMLLENNGYLDSPRIRIYKESIKQYLASDTRPAICAGTSFPNEIGELKKYLNNILSTSDSQSSKKYTKLMAPHIDFKIGQNAHKIYANAFEKLDTDFDLAILLGTAHYKSSDDFMLTKKDFETPLGTVETDREFIDLLEKSFDDNLTFDDLAHRPEHSLELHLILLKYIMANKDFKILPILTGSYHKYFENGKEPIENNRFNKFLDKLNETIFKSEKKVIFLSSGDLSHIGRKFEDKFDAKEQIDQIEIEDNQIICDLINGNSSNFYKRLSSTGNHRNVCGLSPFYSLMKLTDLSEASFAGYHKWYEYDTKSAVTFCGINFK